MFFDVKAKIDVKIGGLICIVPNSVPNISHVAQKPIVTVKATIAIAQIVSLVTYDSNSNLKNSKLW